LPACNKNRTTKTLWQRKRLETVLDLAWHKKPAENHAGGLGSQYTEFERQFKHPLGQAAFQIPADTQADAEQAAKIAARVADEIGATHKQIAEQVWKWASDNLCVGGCWSESNRRRFDA
jgi:hypothetical protein